MRLSNISTALIAGAILGFGGMGAQTTIIRRPGHGRVMEHRKDVVSYGGVSGSFNKIQRKEGRYGGIYRDVRMAAAEVKRSRKRVARLYWCRGMLCKGALSWNGGGWC